jgi:hypothetical protein
MNRRQKALMAAARETERRGIEATIYVDGKRLPVRVFSVKWTMNPYGSITIPKIERVPGTFTIGGAP